MRPRRGRCTAPGARPSFQNGEPEDPEWLLAHIDDFGSPRCENHFNVAWAWALDAPFQWMKQVASHFGGTRNGMAVSWPRGIAARGELRTQFHHVIDLVPTILDAAGITRADAVVNGVEQKPIEGVSMRYSFDDAAAPSRRTTQYFEILGNRAIYHDGWVAACFHGRLPWVRSQAVPFGEGERWELYRVSDDFSQGRDLAAEHPDKLRELQALFDREARRLRRLPAERPDHAASTAAQPAQPARGQDALHALPRERAQPELATVNLKNTSFDLRREAPRPGRRGRGCRHLPGRQHGRLVALREGRDPRLPLQPVRPGADERGRAPSPSRAATSSWACASTTTAAAWARAGRSTSRSTAPRSRAAASSGRSRSSSR